MAAAGSQRDKVEHTGDAISRVCVCVRVCAVIACINPHSKRKRKRKRTGDVLHSDTIVY